MGKSVSRVLSWMVIYLVHILLHVSSHQIRRWRAVLTFCLGVAPDGVYTDPVCHHTSGELLPHLFTIASHKRWAVIFCCTFLKVSLTGRYPASLLCGARTFLVRYLSVLLYATIRFTSLYFTWFLLFCQFKQSLRFRIYWLFAYFVFVLNDLIKICSDLLLQQCLHNL